MYLPPHFTPVQEFLEQLLDAYVAQDDSWPFREPVPITIAPDYYDIIKVRHTSLYMCARPVHAHVHVVVSRANTQPTPMHHNSHPIPQVYINPPP